MESTKFWSRVGHWFRRSGHLAPGDSDLGTQFGLSNEAGNAGVPVMTSTLPTSGSFGLLRRSKPNPQLERLEAEYAKVVNLIDAIQHHLASQAEQSRNIARSLERLAEGVSTLPDASNRQLQLLGSINESIAVDLDGKKRLEENLAQLPGLADAQREAMVSIDRQMDASRETHQLLAKTLEGVGQSVAQLGESSAGSSRALEHMRTDASAHGARVARLVEEQTRKLTIFAWSAIGLASLAAVMGIIALMR